MDKFTFTINPPTLGNPFLEDTFFRSCVQRHFYHDLDEKDHTQKDMLLFGHRVKTDLLLKSNDAEENPPKFKQINVYGEHVNEIQLTMGWKTQSVVSSEEIMSIPYPHIDSHGYFRTILNQDSTKAEWEKINKDRNVLDYITGSMLGGTNERDPLAIPNNADLTPLPPKPVYQHKNILTGRGRLHAFMKNLLYTPSSSMQSCPNAMTDGFSRLMTQMFLNPKLFGPSQTFQKAINSPSLHPRNIALEIEELKAKCTNDNQTKGHDITDGFYRNLLNQIPFDELLTIQATHYALATTTSSTSDDPIASFQPAYTTPISIAYGNMIEQRKDQVDLNQPSLEYSKLQNNTLRTIFTPRDDTGVNSNSSKQANPHSKHQPRRKADYIPTFQGSGQWMTAARGGSDVSTGSTAVALPLSFSASMYNRSNINNNTYKYDNSTDTIQSTRIFSLYGLKYFTSAIDSKFTITLARVLTEDTWIMACEKLNKRFKTQKFSSVPKPTIFNKILVPDANHIASSTYYCKGLFPYADFTIGSSFNNNPMGASQITSSTATTKVVLNTNHGQVFENLDPLHQILQSIPLTCFLVYIKNDDNVLNNIELQRLKEKLGTKQLPTAELLLSGSIALRLSDFGRGVSLIALLFNLSRIHNAVSACGYPARLLMLNRSYAKKRYVFGSYLTANPAHINSLSHLTAYSWLMTNSTLELSSLQGVVEAIGVIKYYFEHEFKSPYHTWENSTQYSSTIITAGYKTISSQSLPSSASSVSPLSLNMGEKLLFVGQYILQSIYNLFKQIKYSVNLPTPDFEPFNPNNLPKLFSPSTTSITKRPNEFTVDVRDFYQIVTAAHKALVSIQPQLEILLRISTPIAKLSTAELSASTSAQLTQLFGALGYMEDSRIPRLLRDSLVLAIWEGTKAVCAHDFIRAITYRQSLTSHTTSPPQDLSLKHRVVDVDIINFVKQIIYTKIDNLEAAFKTILPPALIDSIHSAHSTDNQSEPNKTTQLQSIVIAQKIVPIELLNVLKSEFPFITPQMVLNSINNMFSTIIAQIQVMIDQWVGYLMSIESDDIIHQIQDVMNIDKNSKGAHDHINYTAQNGSSQISPAVIRRSKMFLLEQHSVHVAQGLYQVQSILSLLEHSMSYMCSDGDNYDNGDGDGDEKVFETSPIITASSPNHPTLSPHQHNLSQSFLKRLTIGSTYGLPILFACYRLVSDAPYSTMVIDRSSPAPPSPFGTRTLSPPFSNSSQLSLGLETASTSTLLTPKLATAHLYRLLNQLIAMDELPLLPTDQLLQSRL